MSKKTKAWRKQHLDWADARTFFNYAPVRNSVIHKRINYDLFNGKLHMQDLEVVLNPEHLKEKTTPTDIQHYPIVNSKLQVLRGEESKRVFDFKVVVTNPNSISEIEENKKAAVLQQLQQLVADQSQSDDEFQQRLEKMSDYFTYEWQDMREVRANNLLNHYIKEYDMPLMFNQGFMDAAIVGEEIYQCDIRGGEPIIERVNPLKIRVFKSGYSNRIEDADIIIMEDYWSPGQIIDAYYDVLSKKDIAYIESAPDIIPQADEMGHQDERAAFVNHHMIDDVIAGTDEFGMGFYFDPFGLFSDGAGDLLPFDTNGNVRVLRMYWKSRRRIKKVKSYDPETGEEVYNFYPETYVINEALGEEEEILYINEAWEGTKIGQEIYVNMRPRVIQYNRLTNPSRCHFGIVGSIYNLNESKPYSLIDMMKPYNYLYDVIHDRLNKLMAKNWGKLVNLDLAKVPKDWTIDKWLYFAKKNNIAVIDSFKEGNIGAATGKLAGALNNANSGVIDAELGNSIQMYINMLEFIKLEMSEVVGITRQREGQVSNRETVGGVERATLQSSHITEWIFTVHDDVKKRALECFLETAKIALKGRNLKFSYLLSDGSQRIADIDGDEFAEADYGLVVDNSNGLQDLNQKLDMLAQAALQNQTVSFSTIMKLYGSSSIAEKQRLVENDEKKIQERAAQQAQAEQQAQQAELQAKVQLEQAKMEQEDRLNQRDNETKIIVANIGHSNDDGIKEPEYSQEAKDKLAEQIREFNARLSLDRDKLKLDRQKADTDADLKRQALRKKTTTSSK
ncbi:MAG: hypothetical protein IJV29_18710 [Butyrivibrio sp.]|nr:hypothetical protein [Butyrivibrio sp.]MBQ7431644.1 hypothetical protein [Butyrivibrio sp.]